MTSPPPLLTMLHLFLYNNSKPSCISASLTPAPATEPLQIVQNVENCLLFHQLKKSHDPPPLMDLHRLPTAA